jgi:hypothetical protein
MVLKVKCPCCKAELTIDPLSGEVLSHAEEKKKAKDFDSFLKEQKNRSSSLDEKFRAAQEAEKKRAALLEKKFKLGQEKPIDESEPPPGIQWD